MDWVLLICLLWIVGTFSTLGFGVAEYKKTTWCLALVTSLLWIAFPIAVASDPQSAIGMYAQIFQPEVARAVLNTWLLLSIIAGIIGIAACLVTAARWFMRRSLAAAIQREVAEIRAELEASGFPQSMIDETVQAYENGFFKFTNTRDLVNKVKMRHRFHRYMKRSS